MARPNNINNKRGAPVGAPLFDAGRVVLADVQVVNFGLHTEISTFSLFVDLNEDAFLVKSEELRVLSYI